MYICTYTDSKKIVTNILMSFKKSCQVGDGGTPFSKLPYVREFSNIWFQKSSSLCFSMRSSVLSKFSKTLFLKQSLKTLFFLY